MSKLAPYRKTVAAILVPLVAALAANGLPAEWSAVIVAVATAFGVWAVPNATD